MGANHDTDFSKLRSVLVAYRDQEVKRVGCNALVTSGFLLLVVWPGATSSFLLLVAMPFAPSSF